MISEKQYSTLMVGDVISIGTNENAFQFSDVTIKKIAMDCILFLWRGNTQKVAKNLVLKYGFVEGAEVELEAESDDENEEPKKKRRGRRKKSE